MYQINAGRRALASAGRVDSPRCSARGPATSTLAAGQGAHAKAPWAGGVLARAYPSPSLRAHMYLMSFYSKEYKFAVDFCMNFSQKKKILKKPCFVGFTFFLTVEQFSEW